MSDIGGSDVLTRLDSLVSSTISSPVSTGILKSSSFKKNGRKGNKRITFPNNEEIQEVIGYGGVYDDEEDDEYDFRKSTKEDDDDDDDNLNGDPKPPPLLGSSKTKYPPLITVRPFSHRESSPITTVNKVSPMINGQLVKKNLGSDGDEEESDESTEDEAAKSKVVSARLSFLNGTIALDNERKREEKKETVVSTARFVSTSVIKTVNIKPSISRKPPILKEKPTVKINNRPILERRKSSEDEDDDEDIDDDVISSSSSDSFASETPKKEIEEIESKNEIDEDEMKNEDKPIAAPRKISFRQVIPSQVTITSESKIHVGGSAENKAPPPIKLPLEAKSSFEMNRASIASALEFNRHDKISRPSTKRKAPTPPATEEAANNAECKQNEEIDKKGDFSKSVEDAPLSKPAFKLPIPCVIPKPPPMPPTNIFKNIPLPSASITKISTAVSKHVANFESNLGPPSKEPPPIPTHYIESSFTAGKPIKTVSYSEPVTFLVKDEDEVRKWKEKKSAFPASPDISGEILGSSKKTQHNFLAAAANMVINKAEQQIGAAIDESVKLKKLSEKKFSFKKFFNGNGNSNKKSLNDSDASSSDRSSFLDKEHEREILEREKKSVGKGMRKTRPEIIHPCHFSVDDDATSSPAKIEVVKIIPGDISRTTSGKPIITRSVSSDPQLLSREHHTLSIPRKPPSSVETSSISSSSTNDTEEGAIIKIESPNTSAVSSEDDQNGKTNYQTVYSSKHKPAPPPRRHSLENFGSETKNGDQRDKMELHRVREETITSQSDEDFRNSLLIIPRDEKVEDDSDSLTYVERNYKNILDMNTEALKVIFEKFSGFVAETEDLYARFRSSDLRFADLDVSKPSRFLTKIGDFYEASWEGIDITILLSVRPDVDIASLPTPGLSFKDHEVPSSFITDERLEMDDVWVHVYPPLRFESLESFASYLEDPRCPSTAKRFFVLQLLSSLEDHPTETDPRNYFMTIRKSEEKSLFSYRLSRISRKENEKYGEEGKEGERSLYRSLSSLLEQFDLPEASPPSLLRKRRKEIERTLFDEGNCRLHLQKAEALTRLVKKNTPTLSVVEEFQIKYLLSHEEPIFKDVTYVYTV